jgi:hypothetical protein
MTKTEILDKFYSMAYDKIQSLGGFGLHVDNNINRAAVLQALKETKKELDKLMRNC